MRLIDADKLKSHYAWWNNEEQRTFDQIVDAQLTVETVVHGEWEPSDKYKGFVSCSVCHDCYVALSWIQGGLKWHYCPNCGAKMDKLEG